MNGMETRIFPPNTEEPTFLERYLSFQVQIGTSDALQRDISVKGIVCQQTKIRGGKIPAPRMPANKEKSAYRARITSMVTITKFPFGLKIKFIDNLSSFSFSRPIVPIAPTAESAPSVSVQPSVGNSAW